MAFSLPRGKQELKASGTKKGSNVRPPKTSNKNAEEKKKAEAEEKKKNGKK
jgi:hypothetical protein